MENPSVTSLLTPPKSGRTFLGFSWAKPSQCHRNQTTSRVSRLPTRVQETMQSPAITLSLKVNLAGDISAMVTMFRSPLLWWQPSHSWGRIRTPTHPIHTAPAHTELGTGSRTHLRTSDNKLLQKPTQNLQERGRAKPGGHWFNGFPFLVTDEINEGSFSPCSLVSPELSVFAAVKQHHRHQKILYFIWSKHQVQHLFPPNKFPAITLPIFTPSLFHCQFF